MKGKALLLIVMVGLAAPIEAGAQSASIDSTQQDSGDRERLWVRLRDRDHLLGNLGGAWQKLEDHGATLELVHTAEFFRNTRGGMKVGDNYRGDLSLTLELDTEKAGWWKNGTFFVHLQAEYGEGITDDYVGDFQVLSNIDADDYAQVSELWYQHTFFDQRLRLKLGKMDSTADFAAPEYGGEFINSSPGFHPTIPLVTYPDQDWGIVLGIEPVDWFSMNFGVYQGRPDGGKSIGNTIDGLYGPLVLVEPAFHYTIAGRAGQLRVGGWWLGDEVEKFLKKFEEDRDVMPDETTSRGWWVVFDQELWRENPEIEDDEQGLAFFAQYGWASEDVSEATEYWGGGIQWIGPIPRRDDDVLGLGVFYTELTRKVDFAEHQETVLEFFYRAQVFNWLSIKPDVQYIRDPGGTNNKSSLAVGVRVEVTF